MILLEDGLTPLLTESGDELLEEASMVSTTSAASVTAVYTGGVYYNHVVIVNEGTAAGFASIDNGNTWKRIPAASAAGFPGVAEIWERSSQDVLIKRDTIDMSAVYGDVGWIDF